jgi:hypothetical protein
MSLFTKTVIVEKEVEKIVDRPIPGEASHVDLYLAKHEEKSRYQILNYWVNDGFFLSCKDALDAFPASHVEKVKGVRIGKEIFYAEGLYAVKITKPKRAKAAK